MNDTAFAFNHVARKGGAVNIATGSSPSHVEFHRCAVANSTTGQFIEDDPQGEGGVFNVAPGTRLLLSDSLFIDNRCGNKVHNGLTLYFEAISVRERGGYCRLVCFPTLF